MQRQSGFFNIYFWGHGFDASMSRYPIQVLRLVLAYILAAIRANALRVIYVIIAYLYRPTTRDSADAHMALQRLRRFVSGRLRTQISGSRSPPRNVDAWPPPHRGTSQLWCIPI